MLDEHAQSIFVQIFNKMLLILEYFGDNLGREHVLPVLSVFGTIGFIVAIGYLLAYLVKIEEEDIQRRQSTKNNNNNGENLELKLDFCFETKNFVLHAHTNFNCQCLKCKVSIFHCCD